MSVRDELLTIERQLWTAGADAYRRHVDAECLLAFTAMAGAFDRDHVVATVEGGPRWREPEIELEGVVRPSPDVAVLTYRASAVRGDDERYRALVSSGYVRRDDGWKLMFHHQTPLSE